MMNINEFIPNLHIFVWSLSQNFLESVVVLNQLCESSLQQINKTEEVNILHLIRDIKVISGKRLQ